MKVEIVADSVDPRGNRLTSVLATFPRIILAEVNTHRMLSKNTSSSRAIPFNKMVEAVKENPFIPIAWQKDHKGMQGNEYLNDNLSIMFAKTNWLTARDSSIKVAKALNSSENGYESVTKQLCNRLLEPFMWTTMLITGSKEGWDNFFELRCPQYQLPIQTTQGFFKSKKDCIANLGNPENIDLANNLTSIEWLQYNKGQAEIHMMDLAESIYDEYQNSVPLQLKENQWHIPFINVVED